MFLKFGKKYGTDGYFLEKSSGKVHNYKAVTLDVTELRDISLGGIL